MEKFKVDNGQNFDFGKTSGEYAKYRDIYPQELYDRIYSIGVGKQGTNWLDLGTGTGAIPRGLAHYGANIIAIDIANEQIKAAKRMSKNFKNINYHTYAAEEIPYADNSFDTITACQCFWYFDPNIIVPKIKAMLKNNGIFLKIYMTHVKNDPIASKSYELVKSLNTKYTGASASIKDLTTHYFENPQMDSFELDLLFTRETWHGRIMASRGVLASMNPKLIQNFELKHLAFMNQLPEQFTIRHKIFITYYYLNTL